MRVLLVQPALDSTTSRLTALGMAELLGLGSLAAALPTALPPREYYHQPANLYRKAYVRGGQTSTSTTLSWFEQLARSTEGIASE